MGKQGGGILSSLHWEGTMLSPYTVLGKPDGAKLCQAIYYKPSKGSSSTLKACSWRWKPWVELWRSEAEERKISNWIPESFLELLMQHQNFLVQSTISYNDPHSHFCDFCTFWWLNEVIILEGWKVEKVWPQSTFDEDDLRMELARYSMAAGIYRF